MSNNYKNLISEKVESDAHALKRRVSERFPGSGLSQVAQEVYEVAQSTNERVDYIGRPVVWLRAVIAVMVCLIVIGVAATLISVGAPAQELGFVAFIHLVESGLNDLVFVGLALFFLVSLEIRLKRRKALLALHELRSLAHVIDMHQLTKDPTSLTEDRILTPSSPDPGLDLFHLKRYLDYCSELLSITGKLSAIFAQEFNDPVVLSTVNEVESLTNGLSTKIWQKLIILQSMEAAGRQ